MGTVIPRSRSSDLPHTLKTLNSHSKQLGVTVEKLINILKGNESGEDLLQSLTKMNNELVPNVEYGSPIVKEGKYVQKRKSSASSLQKENKISFSFHSTLTKMVKLP
ncbi:hypothetical protein TNIN_270021 [Trichonephila inaurata madagascariensis]|uniref:Uncharacterized protein n=1 Tax=Trichonephila inaurata madagascariensis TaxID=2747483 RepID=A0A8X6XD81_9ARAC|nr:hypothetical protein TNIN_270021 [Trichonephila inaurata madagascariensis]